MRHHTRMAIAAALSAAALAPLAPANTFAAGRASAPPPAVKRHCIHYVVAKRHHRPVARCIKYVTN